MSKFEVSANGQIFGIYEGETGKAARDACAVDAGYASESDMESRLETPSEFEAIRVLDAGDYALNEKLWAEYIDPDNTTPFESVSHEERVRLAQAVIDSNK